MLKDNITLQINKEAELLASNNLEDYYNIDPFIDGVGQERGNCLIGAKDASNVVIIGEGIIDGRGERMVYKHSKEHSRRPFLIRIVQSSNVKISGITAKNSAAWNIHLYQSKNIAVDGVRILSQSEGNGDGIDIDSSQDVTIGWHNNKA